MSIFAPEGLSSGMGSAARSSMLEDIRLADVFDLCQDDPKFLLNEMQGFDPTLQEHFSFNMFDPEGDWFWQSEIVDWWMDPELRKFLILKARQLGITWLAVAVGLWYLLFRPGSFVVAYSHGQDESNKLLARAWVMFKSLPPQLRAHVDIIRPNGGLKAEPSEWIILRHKESGLLSKFQALPATQKAGHGDTVTFAIMDEVAYMEYARRIYTAINPAVSRAKAKGKLVMISTAYGVSNEDTGEGNYFHRLYKTIKQKRIAFRFLPWNLHPERDEEWYQTEAMALDEVERNQQYPLNENDAFMLSGHTFFQTEALAFYRSSTRPPLFSGHFEYEGKQGRFAKNETGFIDVFALPRPGGRYGISVDVASGKASDYTSASVIDLTSAEIVAKMHSKIEIPTASIQLKFLGRWYSNDGLAAKIIVERQGGWGEALIVALRSTDQGLEPYPNLYRYTKHQNTTRPQTEDYGFPMGPQNRGQVLDQLKAFLRLRSFPFLPAGDVDELGTFVYRDTNPSPRAMDGTNDDRVMDLALAVQLWSEEGETATKPLRRSKWLKRKYKPHASRGN